LNVKDHLVADCQKLKWKQVSAAMKQILWKESNLSMREKSLLNMYL